MRKIQVTHRERMMATRPNVYRNKKKYNRKRLLLILFLIVALVVLSGCKAKETIVDIRKEKDSTEREIMVSNPFTDELIIENFCPEVKDTALRSFEKNYELENLVAKLKYENNRLSLNLRGHRDTIYLKEYVESTKEKEVVKTSKNGLWITRWFWYSVALNIGLLLYCFRKPIFRRLKVI